MFNYFLKFCKIENHLLYVLSQTEFHDTWRRQNGHFTIKKDQPFLSVKKKLSFHLLTVTKYNYMKTIH